ANDWRLEMEKIGFKCITCGKITYVPDCDENTPGVKILEMTQCLKCVRAGEPVSPSVRQRILAKYASGEY
ncbi:unnamed protein product, partial [marine sediment metagenome]